MTPRLPTAEQPLPFLASLPPHTRGWCWLPVQCVTLTLPTDEGRYTAFQVWYCPQQHRVAHNVAQYGATAPQETPP
jgi:hypothetical protein